MSIKLYEPFNHWFHEGKGTVFFYSDPHFGDAEVKAFRKDDISDDEQVRRINSKVGKYDTIVFLGDIGDISFVRKIRGYKVLIIGNHDKGITNYKRVKRTSFIGKDGRNNQFDDILSLVSQEFKKDEITIKEEKEFDLWSVTVDNCLFDEVYEGAVMISPNIILSHEPIPNFPYAINIHGHDHSNSSFKDNLHINLCAELINYIPVSLIDIVKKGINKYTTDIHQETINKANTKILIKEKESKPEEFSYWNLSKNIIRKLCEDDVDMMIDLMKSESENNSLLFINLISELNEYTSKALKEIKVRDK